MYPSVLLKIPLVTAMMMVMVKVMAAPHNAATNLQYVIYMYTKIYSIFILMCYNVPRSGEKLLGGLTH
jgi:hypothetical protein